MGRHEPVSQELVERDPFHPRLLRMEGNERHRLAQERSKRGDGSGYRLVHGRFNFDRLHCPSLAQSVVAKVSRRDARVAEGLAR
jgi:hypothetical protein